MNIKIDAVILSFQRTGNLIRLEVLIQDYTIFLWVTPEEYEKMIGKED